LCTPLSAKAVVYQMPGNPFTGPAWPQTLKEVKTFSISQQGDTVISFGKGCDPVQFDILTGDTPQVINTGVDHGPLLFPLNTNTAYQHPGNQTEDCIGKATTTTTSIAPTTAPSTTTANVLAATTVPTTARVLAATTIPSSSNVSTGNTSVSGLAVTGATSTPFGLIGSGLVLIGIAALLTSRRRNI